MSTGNDIPIARFPLPADWEPEEIACVLVPCPADPQYLETLVGLIGLLAFSNLFARDDTKTGAATVARTWRRALLTQAIVFSECEVQMFQLRQDPNDPCKLQQSLDGGVTWSTAFDYDLCDDHIPVPPYAGSETGPQDAAAAAVNNTWVHLANLADANCAGSRDDYIAEATAYLRQFDPLYANPAALGAFYDAYCALEPEEQAAVLDPCTYIERVTDFMFCADPDGWFNYAGCLSHGLISLLNPGPEVVEAALNSVVASISGAGWNALAAGGGGGGADFGGGDCVWTLTFDKDSALGTKWHPSNSEGYGTWDGEVWNEVYAAYSDLGGSSATRITVYTEASIPFTLRGVIAEWHTDFAGHFSNIFVTLDPSGFSGLFAGDLGAGDVESEWGDVPGVEDVRRVYVGMSGPLDNPDTHYQLKKVTIFGKGPIPTFS